MFGKFKSLFGVPDAIGDEYRAFIRENVLMFVMVWVSALALIACTVMEIIIGIPVLEMTGGFVFNQAGEDEKYDFLKLVLFIGFIVLEQIIKYLFKRTRTYMLNKADSYMTGRFQSSADAECKESSFACRAVFGDKLDRIFTFAHGILWFAVLIVCTIALNVYVGPVYVAVAIWGLVLALKGKSSKAQMLLETLFYYGYYLSLIVLIVMRIEGYGAIFGYYLALMIKMDMKNAVIPDIMSFRTDSLRMNDLNNYFCCPESRMPAPVISEESESSPQAEERHA